MTSQDPAGTYSLQGEFAGDTEYKPSAGVSTFLVTREQTTLVYTGDTVIENGGTAPASAVLAEDDGAPPLPGRAVTFTIGSQSCTALTDAAVRAACHIATVNQPLGPTTITSTFDQDAYYLMSTDSDVVILFAYPSRRGFAVGDRPSGANLTFFGAQWAAANPLSGGVVQTTSYGSAPGQGGTGGAWRPSARWRNWRPGVASSRPNSDTGTI